MIFFRHRKTDFYKLLYEQAETVEEGMKALVHFMREPNPLRGTTILTLEEEADNLRRELVDELVGNDHFMVTADFAAYSTMQGRVSARWQDRRALPARRIRGDHRVSSFVSRRRRTALRRNDASGRGGRNR